MPNVNIAKTSVTGYPLPSDKFCGRDDMVVELQPFVIALIDHVGIKLSFSQHVERKRSMKCQPSQVLFPDQIGPVLVSGVRALDGGKDEISA